MEQIETQVSDLRYLTQDPGDDIVPRGRPLGVTSPLSATAGGDNSAHPRQSLSRQPSTPVTAGGTGIKASAAEESSDAGAGGSNKRKADDDDGGGSKAQRSKRNRYISIACNECKRRKIKCNGETPCARCGNLNLACLYAPNCCSNTFKDSDEFKRMTAQVSRLQEQVENLYQSMSSLRSESLRLPPGQDRLPPVPSGAVSPSPSTSHSSAQKPEYAHKTAPTFRGPTSIAYSLDVANTTINNMGYKGIHPSGDGAVPGPPFIDEHASRRPRQGYPDPLWEIGKDEMVRLCRLHEEEVGIMYPVLNIQSVISHARSLASFMESSSRNGMHPELNDEKTLQLKMVMCCALAVEEHGHSDRARRLYESMEAAVNRKLMAERSNVANLPVLALLAGYRFLSNDEILAWRVMGQVVRLCLELGIHRQSGIMKIQDEEVRQNALMSFWSAYVLDRRWAFGTGLPYSVQDEEIDPQLPSPDEYPYLVAMITYSQLGAKVWKQVSHFGPVLARELRQEEIENLDHEIIQWWENVPDEVRMRNWDKEKRMTSTPSYNLQRLRIWTYLRFNQIRIWLYTPVLHSATSIMSNPAQAEQVVSLANDTIRYLTHLNNTSNIYRKIQVFYHQFLTSAIAVVFLATVHAPVRFADKCRDEFYMALDLVRDLSAKSWVSQRLWRTISALKEVAPRFGLQQQLENQDAALIMTGLAAGTPSGSSGSVSVGPPASMARSPVSVSQSPFPRPLLQSAPVTRPPGTPGGVSISPNGIQLQAEMRRIFEGYVGMSNGLQTDGSSELGMEGDDGATVYADGTVFQHFRELF